MFVGMVAGVLTSIIESIGDYYTCARIAGALPPPPSAVNRGTYGPYHRSTLLFEQEMHVILGAGR